jgi:hypothetical protein
MRRNLNQRLAAAWALAAPLICAPASAMAGPSLTSVEDNVAYAASAICAPYALDQTDRPGLPIGRGLVQPDGHDGLARPNPSGVRVGVAGFVHVTFAQRPDGSRMCDIQARGADPQTLRKVALDALAARPERFAPTKSKYLPGQFASEDMLCAAADGAHPTAFALLSATAPAQRDKVAILLTLSTAQNRMPACDQAGVPMNFRTLAPTQ